MVKDIISTGKYITVGGSCSVDPYISPNPVNPLVGSVHYNPNTNKIEIYDGSCWVEMPESYVNVGLTYEAEELLDWAKEKRDKEQELEALAEENTAVQIALKQLKEAEERLIVTAHLARKHEQTTS